MLNTVKKFNDSKRVALVYGMLLAFGLLIIPIGAFGIFILTHESSNGWSLLGGVWFIMLSVGATVKTVPLCVKDFKNPPVDSDSPMNLWLPLLLIASAALFTYAEYGSYGGRVKQFIAAAPAKMITTILPGTNELFESIEKFDIEELEQNK